MSSLNYTIDPKFEFFLKQSFPEHARRILKARSRAFSVQFFYPFFYFFVPAVFFTIIVFFLNWYKKPIIAFGQDKLAGALDAHLLHVITMMTIYSGTVFVLCSFLIGLALGFITARRLIFEAEKLEINTYFLWKTDSKNEDSTYIS